MATLIISPKELTAHLAWNDLALKPDLSNHLLLVHTMNVVGNTNFLKKVHASEHAGKHGET